jgi:short-subunit dehydrogenase
MSSMSGLIGIPFRTAYCSSKFAVHGFFEVLRNELGKDSKLKITLICPGWVDTDIRSHHVVENHTQQYTDKSKFMSVEDCVNGALFSMAQGKREEKFELKQRLVPFLKAVSPRIVDSMVSKHVNLDSKL